MKYSYIIEGKHAAHGEVPIGGSEELAIIAIILSLLSSESIIIKNIPQTGRVLALLDTLRFLGSTVELNGSQVEIDSTTLTTKVIPPEQTHNFIHEAMLLGVLGITSGRAAARFSDIQEMKELSLHLLLLDKLFSKNVGMIDGYSTVEGTLVGDAYTLPEKLPSLTIHALLLAVKGDGVFTLRNTVQTASVNALIQFLTQLGVGIEVENDLMRITQLPYLSGGILQLPSDQYEVAFWTAVSLITGGEVTLEYVSQRHIGPVLSKMEQLNARYKFESDTLHLWHENQPLQPLEINVQRHKGLDERLVRIFAAVATTAHGHSRFVERELHAQIWDQAFLEMFGIEGSSVHGDEGSELNIFGPTNITGGKIDIASWQLDESALLLALAAEGATTLQTTEDLFQLYHDFEAKLANLGMIVHTV